MERNGKAGQNPPRAVVAPSEEEEGLALLIHEGTSSQNSAFAICVLEFVVRRTKCAWSPRDGSVLSPINRLHCRLVSVCVRNVTEPTEVTNNTFRTK